MNTADVIELPIEPATPADDLGVVEAEQLRLGLTTADGRPLVPSRVHARFRLDSGTRERGLRHVAEIRARLAEGAAVPARADIGDQARDHAGGADVVELPSRVRPGQRAS